MADNGNGNGAYADDHPLARIADDTRNSYPAFLDYVALGPGRSLVKLHQMYQERVLNNEPVPTTVKSTLNGWSMEGHWVSRVVAYQDWTATEMVRVRKEAANHFLTRAIDSADGLIDHVDHQIDRYKQQRITNVSETIDPNNPEQKIRIVDRRVNIRELEALARTFTHLHKEMAALVEENKGGSGIEVDTKSGKIKAYIGWDPDEWDKGQESD